MLTAVGSNPAEFDGKYIKFRFSPDQLKGKTYMWDVVAKGGGFLGNVKWFGRWRKYSFFPASDCIFEETCLGDIAEFIKWATHTQKYGL